MNPERPRVGVAVIVVRDGKVLLGKRKGDSGSGSWGLPAGKLEFHESLETCAHKELREETGLTTEHMTFACVVNEQHSNFDDSHWIHFIYHAEGVAGEPKLMEPEKCEGWEWFAPNNLPDQMLEGHRLAIPAFLEKVVLVDLK